MANMQEYWIDTLYFCNLENVIKDKQRSRFDIKTKAVNNLIYEKQRQSIRFHQGIQIFNNFSDTNTN